jgi:hypothetical protein
MKASVTQGVTELLRRMNLNRRGYVHDFSFWWIGVLVAAGADLVTTALALARYGTETELHPVIRVICFWWGPLWGALIGKFCQLAALALISLLYRSWTRTLCIMVSVLYLAAACFNLLAERGAF